MSSSTHFMTPKSRPRHRAHPAHRAVTASVVAAVAVGCALHSGASALAAPEQGGVIPQDGPEQGGVLPDYPNGSGGNTPQQQPAPTPQPAPGPSYNGPGVLPSPPMDAPYEPLTYQPSYPDAYSPLPSTPLTPPKRVKPVRPIQAPPDTLRIGNKLVPVKSLPPQVQQYLRQNPGVLVSANEWAAYAEAKIAQGLISVGVPRDEASRKAAASVIGLVAGGALGGAVAFTTTAIVVGAVFIPVATLVGTAAGAGVGALVPPQPVNVLPGMAIGAGVGFATGVAGTVAVAALAGAGGAVLGAAIGLGLAYALGTGDPGKNPRQPVFPWQQHGPNGPNSPAPQQQSAPGPTVYRVHLAAPDARRAGLPAVDYQVNLRGDVTASAQVGSRTVRAQIPAAVAKPVYDALGPQGKATADRLTKQAADQLQRAVPGLKITAPPAPVKPHRKAKRP